MYFLCSEYESIAVGVLNQCYKHNKKKCHQLLDRTLPTLDDSTILEIADKHGHTSLMAHSSVQTFLNIMWKGHMASHTSIRKVRIKFFFATCFVHLSFTSAHILHTFKCMHIGSNVRQPMYQTVRVARNSCEGRFLVLN